LLLGLEPKEVAALVVLVVPLLESYEFDPVPLPDILNMKHKKQKQNIMRYNNISFLTTRIIQNIFLKSYYNKNNKKIGIILYIIKEKIHRRYFYLADNVKYFNS